MPHPNYIFASSLALLAVLAACGGGGGGSAPAEPTPTPTPVVFDHATAADALVEVLVTRNGAPLPGVTVTLVEPLDAIDDDDSAANARPEHYRGGTGADGTCRGVARLPKRLAEVDVVVRAPGQRGPYTIEALRSAWGPFAPAARVRAPRADTIRLTVDLQEIQ